MTLIRPGRTGFRGRRAAEADAPFFEEGVHGRAGAQARPRTSISSAEEAESRALWARASMRQKLRGAMTRSEKLAGGIYAAALMVLLGHEWPHHDAGHHSAPADTGGHGGPEGQPVAATAAPGLYAGHPMDATSPADADGLLHNAAYEGGVDLRKFAPGTTIIPSTLPKTPGDHDSGATGGIAPHLGQVAEVAAVRNADAIAPMRETPLPAGHSPGDFASIGGDIPALAQAPAQGADPAGAAQAQAQAKAANAAAAPAESSQSPAPTQAQNVASTTGTTQDHAQSQGNNGNAAQDIASTTGTAPSHGQDTVIAQAQETAARFAATAAPHDLAPPKAQDSVTAWPPQDQADSADAIGSAKGQGQGHAKGHDTVSDTADAGQDHGNGSAKASALNISAGTTVALGQDQDPAKAQDAGGKTSTAQDHTQDPGSAKGHDSASVTADAGQGHGNATAQEPALSTADASHGLGLGATTPEDKTATADASHGQGNNPAEMQDATVTADSSHGQGHAQRHDTASVTADADQGHGNGSATASALDISVGATVALGQDQDPAKAQDAGAKTSTAQDHTQDPGSAKGHDTASVTADADQDHGNATAQEPALSTADASHGQDQGATKPEDKTATADASHNQGNNAAKAQDIADSSAGAAQDHGQEHGLANGQAAADTVLVQHSDHADALLLTQAGHGDATDALSTLLGSLAGADASLSVHLSAALPQDVSAHAHLHASAAHDLTLL